MANDFVRGTENSAKRRLVSPLLPMSFSTGTSSVWAKVFAVKAGLSFVPVRSISHAIADGQKQPARRSGPSGAVTNGDDNEERVLCSYCGPGRGAGRGVADDRSQ